MLFLLKLQTAVILKRERIHSNLNPRLFTLKRMKQAVRLNQETADEDSSDGEKISDINDQESIERICLFCNKTRESDGTPSLIHGRKITELYFYNC